jgi:hypothetical protein
MTLSPRCVDHKRMTKQRLPCCWTQKRMRELADHHDSGTEEDQAEEIEASMAQQGQTVMVVPTKLVPESFGSFARSEGVESVRLKDN